MSTPTLPKRKYKEVWQGGIILGTIWLALGIAHTLNPSSVNTNWNIILFTAMGISYVVSFIGFRKYKRSMGN